MRIKIRKDQTPENSDLETVDQAIARGVKIEFCRPSTKEDEPLQHEPWKGKMEYRAEPRNKQSKSWFIWKWFEKQSSYKISSMGYKDGGWFCIYEDGSKRMISSLNVEPQIIEMGWKQPPRFKRLRECQRKGIPYFIIPRPRKNQKNVG